MKSYIVRYYCQESDDLGYLVGVFSSEERKNIGINMFKGFLMERYGKIDDGQIVTIETETDEIYTW